MIQPSSIKFATPGAAAELEKGLEFQPKFDSQGLIGAVATDSVSGEILMFAWMNADALSRTISTREAHFWSRSRKRLWKKGEESGNVLRITEIRVDCDQDVLWLIVEAGGDGAACHTGARSCFYRRLDLASASAAEGVALERLESAAKRR